MTCDNKTKADCGNNGDNDCEWIQNPLRDSLFNWSSELGSHSIKFNKPDSYACPIQRFDDTGEELPVSIRKDGKYIKTIFKTPRIYKRV